LVDLVTPDQGGDPPIVEYRFAYAANFDAAAATIQDVPRRGYVSPSVLDTGFNDSRFRDLVRFLFDPSDYSITDGVPFFLKMATRPLGGVFGTLGAYHMVVPYNPTSNPPAVLNGDAPMAASLAGSVEINLPKTCDQFIIKNLSGNNLFIAITPGGPEYTIGPTSYLELFDTTSAVLFARGDAGAATFNAICAMQHSVVA
jgi:hypothetical protein